MSEDITFKSLTITEADREASKDFGDKGKFTIRIPLPIMKHTIIAATSRAIGGMDIKSFRPEDYEYIRMIVTLNNVITANPSWWKGADVCPDDDLLFDLWKFYLDSERSFQDKLKKNMVK